ncbi:MAG: ATP-binding protein [Acidimicrobiales bacterium]
MRRVGLRVRLVALVAIGATAVTTLAALALYRDLSGEVSDAITTELRVRMGDLAADLDDPTAVATQRPVIAQVIDPSGQVTVPDGASALLSSDELAALDGELVVDRAVPGIGGDARLLAQPLETASGRRVVGVAATSTAALERTRDRLVLVLLVASPALTAAVTLTAWVLAGAALRPVRRMARRAETISMAAPGERLPQPPGHDEIAELGHTLNAMLQRIESTIAHERAFIDDASHELRTPLAVLRGELELAVSDDDLPSIKRSVHSSLEETDRLARLAENLLTLARADAGGTSHTRPTNLTEAARAAAARLGARPTITLRIDGPDAVVRGTSEWVDQIVTNLLVNALDHANRTVDVQISPVDSGYRLSVADDGPGFPADLLPRAFDRFTRGDDARGRGGTGLGLAIVAALAHSLGGEVHARNGPPLGGAHVEVTLPAA